MRILPSVDAGCNAALGVTCPLAKAPSAMVCSDAEDTRRRLPDRRRDAPSADERRRSVLAAGVPAGLPLPPPPIAHSVNATVSSAPRSTWVSWNIVLEFEWARFVLPAESGLCWANKTLPDVVCYHSVLHRLGTNQSNTQS